MTKGPPYRAVIFDMDGVLTDSEPAFYDAINDMLARYGHHVEMAAYARFIGSATPATWEGLRQMFGLEAPLDLLIAEFEAPLMARLREPRPALPGARRIIQTLRGHGVPIGLCTASYQRWVDAILPSAGLDGLFDVLSTADDVETTKPDPAPYVLAAKRLGFAPEQCIAIEDSRNGITSALRAGTYVVQLRATETAAEPVERVGMVIESLDAFPMELVTRP